jgi:hypothetical protein
LPTWCGGLAGFSRQSIEKHEPFLPGISKYIVESSVPTETFDEILQLMPTDELDLLQIDTEGFDSMLLSMFPFQRVKPKLIHFERKHLSVNELEESLVHLASFGYKFALDGDEDMVALLPGN